jgi:hypothetical protein
MGDLTDDEVLSWPRRHPGMAKLHALVGAAAMEALPDVTNEACMRVADRVIARIVALVGAAAVDRLLGGRQ